MADRRMDLKRRAAAAARMKAATSREAFHMITRGCARAISRLGMRTTFLIGRPRRCGRKLVHVYEFLVRVEARSTLSKIVLMKTDFAAA